MFRKDDTALIEDVVEELKVDPAIESSRVAVTADNGVVTLTGTVPTYWQKVESAQAVWRVLGVRALADDIRVEVPGTHVRNDTDIAAAAAAVLRSHSDLPETIDATVRDGNVTLTGKVDWHFQRMAAVNAIKHIRGVTSVRNQIDLNEAPKVSDVRDRIRMELVRTINQEVNNIDVETGDGTVTLSGTVRSESDAAAARHAAWAVPGVKSVKDLLHVS
ncbi:MAG: BON domain-containing protein [Mycobacterium sp.]|nr:BON domain-containing protein [Mycobacterium sp.]